MKTRTALVACVDATDGAWAFVKGNEKAIHVESLAEGERVFIEIHSDNPGIPGEKEVFAGEGTFPYSFTRFIGGKYRIGKILRPGTRPQPTTVGIVLENVNNHG